MKQKISVTVGKETIALLEKLIEEGRFRNISHALDYGAKRLMREEGH